MKSTRTQLEGDIKNNLVGFIFKQGFSKKNSHLNQDGFLIEFMRNRGDYIDILDIQLDRHERPKFIINAGKIPQDGIYNRYSYKITKDNLNTGSLDVFIRLVKRRKSFLDFGVSHWFDDVNQAKAAFPQLLNWLENDEIGENITLSATSSLYENTDDPINNKKRDLTSELNHKFVKKIEHDGFLENKFHFTPKIFIRDYRRLRNNHIEILEISWKTDQSASFYLWAGKMPIEGIQRTSASRLTVENVRIESFLKQHKVSLHPEPYDANSRKNKIYYSIANAHFFSGKSTSSELVVNKFMQDFSQIEEWFESGKIGKLIAIR